MTRSCLTGPLSYNLSTGLELGGISATGGGANAYAGVHAPDVVGNIRVDQAWGSVPDFGGSVMKSMVPTTSLTLCLRPQAVLVLLQVARLGCRKSTVTPTTKWGGSVMAALQIKNIPTGAGDDIKIDASWARGDTKNVISTSARLLPALHDVWWHGSCSVPIKASASVRLPTLFIFRSLERWYWRPQVDRTAYGIRGAFNHNWDPYWSSSLFGSASAVRYQGSNNDVTTRLWVSIAPFTLASTGGLAAKSADFTAATLNYNVYQVGVVTRWTPVKNLTFSAEVQYFRLDQKYTGAATLAAAAPKPTTVYEYKDQDTVSFNVRAQRNF